VRHDGWTDPVPPEHAGFTTGWAEKLDDTLPRVLGPTT
jgi:hypothetical protein